MMIRLDTSPASLTYPVNSDRDLKCVQRFIVLVPVDIDYSAATQRIWEFVHTAGMLVQLLGLCKDAGEESSFRRELITMASLLQDDKVSAEAKVNIGTNCMHAAKANYRAGDVIVCFAEQCTGLLQRPLSQMLQSNFKATVYVLSGLAPGKSKPSMLSQISMWLGSIGIIIGFGLLQAKIVQFRESWLQNILLILSIIPELWLIWAWDGWFG